MVRSVAHICYCQVLYPWWTPSLAPTFRMMDILGPDASFHRHRANTEPTTQGHQRGSVSWVSLYCPPPDHTGWRPWLPLWPLPSLDQPLSPLASTVSDLKMFTPTPFLVASLLMELDQVLIPVADTLSTLLLDPHPSSPSSFRPLLSTEAPALVSLTGEPLPHLMLRNLHWDPCFYQVKTHLLSVFMHLTKMGRGKGPWSQSLQLRVLSSAIDLLWGWGKTCLSSKPQFPSSQDGWVWPAELSS